MVEKSLTHIASQPTIQVMPVDDTIDEEEVSPKQRLPSASVKKAKDRKSETMKFASSRVLSSKQASQTKQETVTKA